MIRDSTCYIAVLALIAIYLIYQDEIDSFVSKSPVCNSVDGRCYKVVEKFEQSRQASELLALLNAQCVKLMRHLRNKYLWSYSDNQRAKDIVTFLLSNYNQDGIVENAPNSDVNTSYVDDKGKVFAICLREKQSGKNMFHKIDELMFVVLHEMSHMATFSYGHETDFWTNFKFLLTEAKEAGIHNPVDYSKVPINYCSLKVDYNPYFDKKLEVI